MKRLIVTADDFGASLEINDAVERAHREGVLTAASLMVAEPFAQDAVQRARALPNLAVGLHVALTNARSMLPRTRVPDLVDGDGFFDRNLARAGVRYFFLPRVRWQLEDEIRAQFEAFAQTGLVLDHVDAHNHMHVHPTLFSTIVRIGREFGAPAMRVPVEPFEPNVAGIGNAVTIGPWAALMRSRLRRLGIKTNDYVFGLNDTGKLDEERVMQIVARLPDGVSELYCHPERAKRDSVEGSGEAVCHPERAKRDSVEGSGEAVCHPERAKRDSVERRRGTTGGTAEYARPEELEALLSPRVRAAIEEQGIELTTYSRLDA
jgi:hopanoid biosynthesis associated protein HpnK